MANGNESGARVARVEDKLDALATSVDVRFAEVADRFDQVDAALVEQRQYTEFAYERLEARFAQVDARFEQVDTRLDRVEGQLGRLDRKVDRILDLLSPPSEA